MQKEVNKDLRTLLKGIVYVTPFFLGWHGLLELGEGDSLECAYKSVQLYLMEYSVETEPLNMAVTIAKIAAPLMTAAFLASLLYSLFENLQIWWRLRQKDVVAFHGDSANIDEIQAKLGKRAIVSERPQALKAKKHVLMFNEDVDMYHYIDRHGVSLFHEGEKEIFLCSEKILRGCYENSRIVVCNVAENCARTYWQQYPIQMKAWKEGEKPEFVNEKILLIGFDNYGQRLLSQGILKNVVSEDSAIEYHVCGRFASCGVDSEKDEYASYLDTHLMLHKAVHIKRVSPEGEVREIRPAQAICENQDTVYFHDATWQKVLGRNVTSCDEHGSRKERPFDRVIICKDLDAQNMEILNELKTFFVTGPCHIKYSDDQILKQLWDCKKDDIHTFGVDEELYDPEVILKETLFYQAMMIHGRYFAKHMCKNLTEGNYCDNQVLKDVFDEQGQPVINEENGKPEKEVTAIKCLGKCIECKLLREDWGKQNNFIRYSNVAQADHIPEKLRILLGPEATLDTEEIHTKIVKAYEALKPSDDPEHKETEEEKQAKMKELHRLWKIEHIRWDRYHFMNNYDWAPVRDKKNRKHHLLIPYEELSWEDKCKDEDTYLSLGEILAPMQ